MKNAEIAERIHAHLKRFEADPRINRYADKNRKGLHPYFHARSWASGNCVYVQYVSYQGSSWLTKEQATAYLEWLDAGNVGQHLLIRKNAVQRSRK